MSTRSAALRVYKKTKLIKKTARELNKSPSTIYYHLVKAGVYRPLREPSKRGGRGNKTKPDTRLTPQLAEFLGIHTGDGSYIARGEWWLKEGVEEILYCKNFVSPLLNDIFQITARASMKWWPSHHTPKSVIRSRSAILLRTLEYFGFMPGKKSYYVAVPQPVVNAGEDVRKGFLRGLFDTDGTIGAGWDRRPIIVTVYTRSKDLALGVDRLINMLGMETRKITVGWGTYRVALSRTEYENWMSNIGTSNIKHATKWEVYKRSGEFLPHTTLRGRLIYLEMEKELREYIEYLKSVGFVAALSNTDEKLNKN